MADVFQPKFVDLVRNYTSSTGTDDFVLGPAVNGFSSFTDACVAGDSFYYAATGVDSPSEREVGRGTLTANGKISRDPLSGVKTDFTNGTKSIALIAASEWFNAVELSRSSPVNVKAFGAKGDASDDGSAGTDDTAAIQAALDHVGALGGGAVYFPEGKYKVTSYLTVPPSTTLRGAGRKVSKIVGTHAGGGGATPAENLRNGSILYDGHPINTSSRADLTIEQLYLFSANGDNQGACFYSQSGVNIVISDCETGGAKWGVVLDQSEDVLLDNCELSSWVAGGAGLWIVNGNDLDPTAFGGCSNIINITNCKINVLPDSCAAVDDGGYNHSFRGCNFVCGINGLRAAGVSGLQVHGCYFESQINDAIHLDSLTLAGNFSGGSVTTIIGGQFSPTAPYACIRGSNSPGTLTVIGGDWSAHTPPLVGTGNFYSVAIIAPAYAGYPTSAQFCDGTPVGPLFESSKLSMDHGGGLTVTGKVVATNVDVAKVGLGTGPGSTSEIYFERAAAGGDSYVSLWKDGARECYGFFLNGPAVQFAAEGTATKFQFLSPLSCTSSITSNGGGVGYSLGAGGKVTQATSKSTGVTLNKLSGQITLAADALDPSTTASFLFTNSQIGASDLLVLNHVSGGTMGAYNLNAHGAAPGAIRIDVTNISAASLAEPIVIGFAIVKGATA